MLDLLRTEVTRAITASRLFHYFILFSLSTFVNFPKLFQEIHPFMFCDEEIYVSEILILLNNHSWERNSFLQGNMNIFPSIFVAKLAEISFGALDLSQIQILSRITLTYIPLAITAIVVYKISHELFNNKLVSFISGLVFIFSPYVYANSRYSYPDHSIYLFVSLFVLFVLKSFNSNYKVFYSFVAGFFLALSVSTKYTSAVIILIPLLFGLQKILVNRKNFLRNLLVEFTAFISLALSCIMFVFLLNFVTSDFRDFIVGFQQNKEIYESFQGSFSSGAVFYLVSMLVLPIGILGLFVLLFGIANQKFVIKNFTIFIAPAFIFIYVMGEEGVVLQRSISFMMVLIVPFFAYSIHRLLFISFPSTILIRVFVISALILPLSTTIFSINNDLQPDSRILAREWIAKFHSDSKRVGVNDACSGESAAKIGSIETVRDPYFDLGLDLYVFNSYWPSSIQVLYFEQYGILQTRDLKYFHFYNFNSRQLWNRSPIEISLESLIPSNYNVVKVFKNNGPEIVVIEIDKD
jgi:hypothetical protein